MKLRSWLIVLALTGCVGTDVGNPPDDRRITATLEFEAFVGASPSALVVAEGTTLEEAWLAIDAIHVGYGDCDDPQESIITGPFFVELVSRTILPEPPVVATVPTTLCSLKLEVVPHPAEAGAPEELVDRALYVRGFDGDQQFEVESSNTRMLPYVGKVGLQADSRLVDAFDPSEWVLELNGRHSVTDADPATVNAFWNAMRRGSRIVQDRDTNGEISASEFQTAIALPE